MSREMNERFQKFSDQMSPIRQLLLSGKYPAKMSRNDKRQLRKQRETFKIKDDKLYRSRRGKWVEIITTPSEAYEKMKLIHETNQGHIGIVKTKSRIAMKYYWHGMSQDVINYITFCQTCQQSEKFKRHAHTSSQKVSDPLEVEEMDLSENSASAEGKPDVTKLPFKNVRIQLEEDTTNYLYTKMMGGKLTIKKGVVPHIFHCHEEHLPQKDIIKLLEENLLETSSLEDNDDAERCEAYVLEPPVKHVGVQTSMLHFRNELSDEWIEFDQDASILSCLTQYDASQSELQRRVSSNNSSISVFSDPLETYESTSDLAHSSKNENDDEEEEFEDPAVLLATGKGTQLMKLLRKYRKEKKFSSAPLRECQSSSATRRQCPVDDAPQCMTQTSDQHTTFKESEVLPQQDPFTISIEGVTYRSIFKSHEEDALSMYIAKECVNMAFVTIPVLCNKVYDFCVMYGISRPPAWDLNQSADKEWFQGFMRRHPFYNWNTVINNNESRILKQCDKLIDKIEFILVPQTSKEENEEDKKSVLCDIALDHNYALSTIPQPV
uniref:Integrase zinc-binding domain-containing protein n=1 Tax=Scylla olivacea TaxID=85551 RepID=A0A0P4W6N1_SCYOL